MFRPYPLKIQENIPSHAALSKGEGMAIVCPETKERTMSTQLDMYKARQHEIVREYNGKIIAVKDGEVLGAYPSKTEAFDAVVRQYSPGEFIVIKCTEGDEEYTRRFRSRAIFSTAEAPA